MSTSGRALVGITWFLMICCVVLFVSPHVFIIEPISAATVTLENRVKALETTQAVLQKRVSILETAVASKTVAVVAPTAKPLPTVVLAVTSVPISLPEKFIVDIPALIGKSLPQVEKVLGSPAEISSFDIGEDPNYSGAGELRNYKPGKYEFANSFDTQGKLRVIEISGIAEDGYALSDWRIFLAKVGMHTTKEPDVKATQALSWNNIQGYRVSIDSDGTNIESIVVSMIE